MPVGGVSGTTGVTGNTSGPASSLGCKAFQGDALLNKVASGAVPALAKGAAKSGSVQLVQTALFSLGFLQKRTGLDGSFGPGTEAAVKAFQESAGLDQTGKVDSATLAALDQASAKQIASLKAATLPAGSKRTQYNLVADISNPAKTRLYVLDSKGNVAARYLTSPGQSAFPTQGSSFTIPQVLVRKPWNPPSSSWAANAKQVPPGIDNPMGLCKLSLGAYAEYIHGIPASEEAALGKAASHGCLRMSGSNILELAEKYAEAGTQVTINRDARKSNALEASYEDANLRGVRDRPTDAGREYLFGYLSGELGKDQSYSSPNVG
jgi:lipoprotein-anchoring transpeptidase ErfK/SrfK